MAIFYIIQQLLSLIILTKLKKLYSLISLAIFFIIFFYKPDTFDIYTYTGIVDYTHQYEIFFASVLNTFSFFIEDNRTVITLYQIFFLCIAASITLFFRKSDHKLLILAIIFSSVGVMIGVHNNLRQGTASIFILLGIFSFIFGKKKLSIILLLSSLGFHDSSILFILMFFSINVVFFFIYKKFYQETGNKNAFLMYIFVTCTSLFCSIFIYYFIYYLDYITTGKTNYINLLRSVEYGEFRSSLTFKTILIFLLTLISEFILKFRMIKYDIDFFRFFRIFIILFCFFISFHQNFNEIGNRILYFYYFIELGLLCLLVSQKYFNAVAVILCGYAFAFNVWTIVGGI